MGIFSSKEKQPEPALLNKPWREEDLGKNDGDLQYVQNYKPAKRNIKHLRVLLYGPVGAGKSSFINSVNIIMRRRNAIPAAASATTSDKSFTKKYQTHRIQIGRGDEKSFYPFVFNDIMGVENGTDSGVCPEDIKLAMEGHVKEGYKFNPVAPLSEGDQYYKKKPSDDDKVHVLVCVLSANAAEIKDSVLQKMSSVRQTAADLGIPQMAIITNIDAACPETEKDLKIVYKSSYMQDKMKKFSSAIGIPLNCMFPVKNYSYETRLNKDVDTLIVSALRPMIDFGDDFIENIVEQNVEEGNPGSEDERS